jgi:hypothetical protein
MPRNSQIGSIWPSSNGRQKDRVLSELVTYYAAAISAQLGYDPVERIQHAGLTRGTSNHGDETSREALAPELVRQH